MVTPQANSVAGASALSESPRRGYQPALDGVRAVAVLAVMAYHVSLPFATGGWVGVDVFFVLSGFLITRVLMAVHTGPWRRSLRSFYLRRALRLLPPLAVVLAFTFVMYSLLAPPTQATHETLLGVPASVFYVANWLPALGITNLGFLGHMWSLSVEEHFYVLWPMIFRALWTPSPRRTARRVMALFAAAAVYRIVLVASGAGTNRLYTGTDARAEELFAGCLLAVLFGPRLVAWAAGHRRACHASLIGALAALGVVATSLPVDSRWVPRGGSTLIELAAAIVIAHLVVFPRALPSRVLAGRPLVWLGRRSYGIYLWHLPVGGLAAELIPVGTPLARAGSIALVWATTFTIAALSYRFVERPFLRGHEPRGSVEIDLRLARVQGAGDDQAVGSWQSADTHNLARAR